MAASHVCVRVHVSVQVMFEGFGVSGLYIGVQVCKEQALRSRAQQVALMLMRVRFTCTRTCVQGMARVPALHCGLQPACSNAWQPSRLQHLAWQSRASLLRVQAVLALYASWAFMGKRAKATATAGERMVR